MSNAHAEHGAVGVGALVHQEEHAVHDDSGHMHPHIITVPKAQVTRDILGTTAWIGSRYKLALLITGGLLLVGVATFTVRAVTMGFDTFTPWSYLMASFAFLLCTAMSAPMVSIGQRMLRSHWRRPVGRIAELFAVVGVFAALIFIPLILMMPSAEHRRTIWFEFATNTDTLLDWPAWSLPLLTDLAAVIGLAILGMAILIVGALPDNAAMRAQSTGFRRSLLNKMVFMDWKGTERQWAVHRSALVALGAMYFLFLVLVQTIVISDFGMSLVPGWISSILPATQTVNGFQGGLAATLVALALLRWLGGPAMKEYITVDQFWSASKILLALSLLFFYFWFSDFIIYWYGRQPREQGVLALIMAQSYRLPFLIALACCWGIPFLILLWNSARKSILWPTVASCVILFGIFVDKVRIYVASFVTADVRSDLFTTVHPEFIDSHNPPPAHLPGIGDIFLILGVLGGSVFIYLLAMKVIPALSIWELQEGMLYRKIQRFLKTRLLLMGKPE